MNEQLLRALPKVDELQRAPELAKLCREYGEKAVTEGIRSALAELRREILEGCAEAMPSRRTLCSDICERVSRGAMPSLRPVINATGIILHTNLGRACLSEGAARAAADAARRYSTLEYNVGAGQRGSRGSHVEGLLCRLTGAEAAMTVNNNAAAVLLTLSALTQGGQVPISRGELVEIGGSFRVPDIMEACGAQLKEVGTTNKTNISDYERAIGPETKALMKVHTSNYRIVGFTEKTSLAELVELGHRYALPVIADLGSGALTDLECFGIHGEPWVQESLRAGVDVLCFSGDKLLGGPQAGIILGQKKYLDILKRHPLSRAMRVDKMTLAALEATLRSYESGREKEIPTIAMLSAESGMLEKKAERLREMLIREGISSQVVKTEGQVGGGSVPGQSLASFAVALCGNVEELEQRLRQNTPPIIGRIHGGCYLLDVRTLWDEDLAVVAQAVGEALT